MRVLAVAAVSLGLLGIGAGGTATDIAFNDNTRGAGSLRDGVLELELDVVAGTWRPLGPGRPSIPVLAFAERGAAPTNPGPMIRVRIGTPVRVTVANSSDSTITIHGLGARRTATLTPLRVPARATREIRFTADAVGTYYYMGAIGGRALGARVEDSQLNGALIVDPVGEVPADRVLLMSLWAPRRSTGEVNTDQEVLTFNGRPWPFSERLQHAMGDSIRWRIINASASPHLMHLHGFYFRVDAAGDLARDTLYWESGRRMAVTERMEAGGTASLTWSPDRPGGWIFHCHMAEHVVPNPLLPGGSDEAGRLNALKASAHHEEDPDQHATEGMGGLVIGIYVRPPAGYVIDEPKRRAFRLFIQAADAQGGASGKRFSYILQEGPTPPAPDSARLPGSPIILRQGEPTSITVINRTAEPSQVHWHGLEIESFFDGVAGASGYPGRLTPAIAPGDSFEIRVTPPRAGSFMYHTHMSDLRQQGSGLYGPLLVLAPGTEYDSEHDRTIIFGESPFRDDEIPVINGEASPLPGTMKVGETYRLRLMQITLGRPSTRVRLTQDGYPVRWTPVAKDGFDLPDPRRTPSLADHYIGVGETYDHAFRPTQPGELRLEYRTGAGVLLAEQVIRVVPR
jgi:FtsP/CotA-like multicopper oxidase with cupredoxin domain